jgi:diguanylate cyclase (GGDEF)-like protein/PAS domain S-box-containing protein
MDTVSAKRKNDAVLTVRQNNADKRLEIEDANHAVEKLLGYSQEDLKAKVLEEILPDDERDVLESFLEYDEAGEDLATIFRRIRNFRMLNKSGAPVPVSLKVFYVMASDPHKPEFELLMRDITLINKLEELRAQLAQDREVNNSSDERVGLPSREMVLRNLDMICQSVSEYPLEVSFAVIHIDELEKYQHTYGDAGKYRLLNAVGQIAAGTLREGDVVGYIGDGLLGMVLLDCNSTDAQSVLNRVRMIINSRQVMPADGVETNVTVSMGYQEVPQGTNAQQIVDHCRQAVQKSTESGGNAIYEY